MRRPMKVADWSYRAFTVSLNLVSIYLFCNISANIWRNMSFKKPEPIKAPDVTISQIPAEFASESFEEEVSGSQNQ